MAMSFDTSTPQFRIGHGFDVHRLIKGRDLIVGGVQLDHDRGCDAHSDGDVVYHVVTDAILGALGQDDIGTLFPDDDASWRGVDSSVFVAEAVRRMEESGFTLVNVDLTVILERPRIAPHRTAICDNLAELLDCDPVQVNVKGRTHEQMDAVGDGRAIACHGVVLLAHRTRGDS